MPKEKVKNKQRVVFLKRKEQPIFIQLILLGVGGEYIINLLLFNFNEVLIGLLILII